MTSLVRLWEKKGEKISNGQGGGSREGLKSVYTDLVPSSREGRTKKEDGHSQISSDGSLVLV